MVEQRKIGLALGSGAARGLAHIGVIKVLKENNIPIDYIAGTSAGAMVASYYAINENVDEFEKKVKILTKKDLWGLVDFTIPKKSIIKGDKIKKFLEELYGKKDFSETKIPLKIVATDIYSGDEVILSKGNIVEAVRASISIPGIFAPVEIDGKILVDGGLVNSTPVDVVKKMGAEIIIAVDLPMAITKKDHTLDLIGMIIQSFEIMRSKVNNIAEDENTIIIAPYFSDKIPDHQFYNKEYIEIGEKVAKEAIPKIKKMMSLEK